MFQNWLSIQDFMVEHQKDLLREAEADRKAEAMRRGEARRTGTAQDAGARRSCRDCPGQIEAAHAV